MSGRGIGAGVSLTVALLLGGSVAPPATGEPRVGAEPAPRPAPIVGGLAGGTDALPFSGRRAKEHVRAIAGDIGPRPAGSRRYGKAVDYVLATLGDLGYRAWTVSFPLPQGGKTRNVVAVWPGTSTHPLLLGAHLDTVRGSPGANDNASGVAILLELARSLAGSEDAGAVRLVAFGAEEVQTGGGHHLGSASYVSKLTGAQKAALKAMVSVDMVGKKRQLIVGWTFSRSGAVRRLMRAARAVDVPAAPQRIADVSDHGPFERAGLPAAMLWTGFEPNHHQLTDVPSNVARLALKPLGRLLQELVRRA